MTESRRLRDPGTSKYHLPRAVCQGSSSRRLPGRPPRLAAGDLQPGPGPRARGRSRCRGDDQATVQPYFVLDGNICAFLAAKDHVNVFLYDGAIVPDPEGIITAGHDNKTARTVAFRRDEKINERALLTMFRQIIANNRAGGWRKLKGDR